MENLIRILVTFIFSNIYPMAKAQMHESGPSGAIYGLGLIGAAVYFISHATGFWMGVLGFLKAIVWPAFLVYEAIKSLGM